MKHTLKLLTVLLLALQASLFAADPDGAERPVPLWPHGAPGALGTTERDNPTLTPYLSANPSGAAMLIIPGGGYGRIYEGQTEPFALWLNQQGIAAFVLRYRLGKFGYRYPSQLHDAVEAMRQIREQAEKWKIDPHRIGAMGFSAGGHLVTTLLNRPEDGDVPGVDTTGRASSRPDIAIVCYPVISMITKPHPNSSLNLLGDTPDEELLRRTSSELQVRTGLPPVFLWHTSEDKLVPADHTLLYASALREHGIPHELHIYQHGGHGTGMIGSNHPWLNDLVSWLRAQKFMPQIQQKKENKP